MATKKSNTGSVKLAIGSAITGLVVVVAGAFAIGDRSDSPALAAQGLEDTTPATTVSTTTTGASSSSAAVVAASTATTNSAKQTTSRSRTSRSS